MPGRKVTTKAGDRLHWGILGTGRIARKFADQLRPSERAKLAAAGSRSEEAARPFAREFGGTAYGDYEGVLADPAVEAVYIALPNHLHCEWTLKALRAGKHVLCEKPIAANAVEAQEMFAAARAARRVLVEAYMYRCLPAVKGFIEMARGGAIGEVKLIRSTFTFNQPLSSADPRYQPRMAGGSLMDLGGYCLNLIRAIAGAEPAEMRVFGHLHPQGVDDYAAALMRFGDRPLASFTCGMTVESDRNTFVSGTEGWMAIDFPWLTAKSFLLVKGLKRKVIRLSTRKTIFTLEAEAFADIVQNGAKPWLTELDTLGNMRALDELRRQLGVTGWEPPGS